MKPNIKTAIFPGSFDPFTLGHLDVLSSALTLFDKIIIAVGYNHTKKGFFKPETRVEIIKETISKASLPLERIDVMAYEGLTIDFCRKQGASFIIRGLRTTTDFELESVIAQANKKMDTSISTIFIPASGDYSFISSTVVRDVLINGGDVSSFMQEGIDLTKYLEKG